MKFIQNENIDVIVFQVAKEGNSVNGDSYFLFSNESYFICVVADGLGSGTYAYESSAAVTSIVKQYHHADIDTLMDYCNKVLLYKRGAAVSIIKIHFDSKELEYSCVGNIRFMFHSPSGKTTYPLPVTGYLSGKPQSFRRQKFSYEPNTKFLIYTDGFYINSSKSILNMDYDLKIIATEIKKKVENINKDDATFIVGTILN